MEVPGGYVAKRWSDDGRASLPVDVSSPALTESDRRYKSVHFEAVHGTVKAQRSARVIAAKGPATRSGGWSRRFRPPGSRR